MSNYLVTEINCETGEIIEREMTNAEKKQREIDDAIYQQEKKAEQEKIVAKTALLEKLGITENEARLLLG